MKDMYGKDSVQKLECIGHVQKRVGCRLRKLKKTVRGLGGKRRLTDAFIDRLQQSIEQQRWLQEKVHWA